MRAAHFMRGVNEGAQGVVRLTAARGRFRIVALMATLNCGAAADRMLVRYEVTGQDVVLMTISPLCDAGGVASIAGAVNYPLGQTGLVLVAGSGSDVVADGGVGLMPLPDVTWNGDVVIRMASTQAGSVENPALWIEYER